MGCVQVDQQQACTSWTAVDPLQQPPDSQMPLPNCQHGQTGAGVPGVGGMQGAHAEMGSSTGAPKAWVRRAFTPGGCGGAWLGKLAWQCRKLTPWVWCDLGCSKEISNGKTSRFFWKPSSYLPLLFPPCVSCLLCCKLGILKAGEERGQQ